VQEWVGRVRIEEGRVGDHYENMCVSKQFKCIDRRELTILIVPSQELDANVSFATRFQ
jgi:hypothetical protein